MMNLFKDFTFTEPEFRQLVFSDSTQITLDLKKHYATLRLQSDKKYDIESEVTDARWVRTLLTTPQKSRKLKLMESVVTVPTDTIVGYLLGDGTNAYYWTGSDWTVVDPDLKAQWNTEAEINEGIESFSSVTSFCIFIRLGTDDSTVSPTLEEIRLLYEADILSWDESMLKNTLERRFEQDIILTTDINYKKPGTSSSVDFSTVIQGIDEAMTFKEPVQVFNMTDDPDLHTDLFSSYDGGTKIISLTVSVDGGKSLLIRSTVVVPVTLEGGHPDYVEMEQCPNLTLSESNERVFHNYPSKPYVADKENKVAYEATYAKRAELNITVSILASNKFDLFRIQESVNQFIEANRLLKNEEIDEDMVLWQSEAFNNVTTPSIKGIFTSNLTLNILFNVVSGIVVEKPLITNVNLTLTLEG